MTVDIGTAMLLLLGLAGVTIIQESVKILFSRMRVSDYLTTKQLDTRCQSCSDRYGEKDKRWEKKLDGVAKLIIAIAVKVRVEGEDPQELIKSLQELIQ